MVHLIRSGGPWGFQWLTERPWGSCQGPSPCDLQETEGHHCLTQRLHRKRALAQERNTIPGFYKVTAHLGDRCVKILQQFILLIAHHCQYLQWTTTVWSRNLSSMSLKEKQSKTTAKCILFFDIWQKRSIDQRVLLKKGSLLQMQMFFKKLFHVSAVWVHLTGQTPQNVGFVWFVYAGTHFLTVRLWSFRWHTLSSVAFMYPISPHRTPHESALNPHAGLGGQQTPTNPQVPPQNP